MRRPEKYKSYIHRHVRSKLIAYAACLAEDEKIIREYPGVRSVQPMAWRRSSPRLPLRLKQRSQRGSNELHEVPYQSQASSPMGPQFLDPCHSRLHPCRPHTRQAMKWTRMSHAQTAETLLHSCSVYFVPSS